MTSGFDSPSGRGMGARFAPYFRQLLDLMSDLSLGRNYKAINLIEKLYPYDAVFSGLVSTDLPYPLRSAFCKLMLAVHVNREPQVRPSLVVVSCRAARR
jgi:hypothetical protein